MNTTIVYNRTRFIKDDKFNIEYISQYELLLLLNGSTFYTAVIDSLDHRCLFFEEFELSETGTISALEELFDEHMFLRAAYWKKIKFSQYNNKFTLIPNGLFVAESAFDYLDLITDIKFGQDKVLHYKHENHGMISVFSVDFNVYQWLTAFYATKKIVFIHPTSSHIDSLLKVQSNESNEVIDLCFNSSSFGISYKKNNKLEFCNIFDYSSEEDIIYYLFAVFDSLNVDIRILQCNLYGQITHNSTLFPKIKEIIRSTKFGTKPNIMQFGFHFDEVFLHQYNDLFPMYIC